MALHFGGLDGNTNVTLGGIWNAETAQQNLVWANSFRGATSFTLALSVKPDPGFISTYAIAQANFQGGHLFHQWASSFYLGTFKFYRAASGALTLEVANEATGGGAFSGPSMLPGEWNRMVVRWSGTLNTCAFTLNGVTTVAANTSTAITELSTGFAYGPLEVGALSQNDEGALQGDYAEAACWIGYLAEIDALHYSRDSVSPDALPATGRIEYVDLNSDAAGSFAHPWSGPGNVMQVNGRWTGQQYGLARRTYDFGGGPFQSPYQGAFSDFSIVAHPQVFGSVPLAVAPEWYDDPQMLPQRGFETWEMLGDPGARTGTIRRVPEDFATVQAAMVAAVYGDDISVAVGSTIDAGGQFLVIPAKTFDPSDPALPRCWPHGRVPIEGSVPIEGTVNTAGELEGSVTISSLAYDPAYIHVYARNYGSTLPTIAVRKIPLPDGTESVVYDAPDGTSCRVYNDAHKSVMAEINAAGVNQADNYKSPPNTQYSAHHWMFRGLRFIDRAGGAANTIVGNPQFQYGTGPYCPDHILFNQCVWDPDPNNTGPGAEKLVDLEGEYIGFINCDFAKFYRATGYGYIINSYAMTWGPLHFENNHSPTAFAKSFLFGGGGSVAIGVQMQDCVYRRNWQVTPLTWGLSEVNPFDNPTRSDTGWSVRVESDLVTVTYLSGGSGGFGAGNGAWMFSPYVGCTMWEPTTGRARRIVSAPEGDSLGVTMTLGAAWPGPAGTYTVYFHMPPPGCVYNSGVDGSDFTSFTDVPTATVANGSTTVNFSVAMPLFLKTAVDNGYRPFFYLTNLHWEGGGSTDVFGEGVFRSSPTPAGHSPKDTGYGNYTGVTYANCRRKKIVAIAANRLSCTLENGYIAGGEATTFPYAVVSNDGLFRGAHLRSQNAWQLKFGASRFLFEGNVLENQIGGGSFQTILNVTLNSTIEPNNPLNWIGGQTTGYTFTCENDIIAISPDPGSSSVPPNGRYASAHLGPNLTDNSNVALRSTFNPRGWPHPDVANDSNRIDAGMSAVRYPYLLIVPEDYTRNNNTDWPRARFAKRVIDSAHIELEPYDGLTPGSFTDTPAPQVYAFVWVNSPWITSRGLTYRHNVNFGIGASGFNTDFGWEQPGEHVKGRYLNIHDNVYLIGSDGMVGAGFIQGGVRRDVYGSFNAAFGQENSDESWGRVAHNTYAHLRTAGPAGFFHAVVANAPNAAKGHHIHVDDNLVAEYGPGSMAILAMAATGQPYNPIGEGGGYWEAPYSVRRNVFAGPAAPADLIGRSDFPHAFQAAFPDNAGVASVASVGYASYDAGSETDLALRFGIGATDPLDFSGYALAPVTNAGTVSLSGDGLTVTKTSGTFPATVVAGQFFRTGGASVRIQSVNGGLTACTLVTPHPAATGSTQPGLSYTIGFQGSAIDGRDPGANYSLVAQFTRNVRRTSPFVAGPIDIVPPTISISTNGGANFGVTTTPVTIAGVADDDVGVTFVSWSTNRGFSGNASGTLNWTANIPLVSVGGAATTNVITVTAHDTNPANDTSDTITVTFTPPADAVIPTVAITTNGGANFSTSGSPLTLDGSATDNIGVASVTWSCDTGGNGNAALASPGATSTTWTITGIALTAGANVITVTAKDAATNASTAATITVTKTGVDTTAPTIDITSPAGTPPINTAIGTVTVSGTAADNVGVDHINYIHYRPASNNTGAASVTGAGTPSATWSVGPLSLSVGSNTIIPTVFDAVGNNASDSIEIIYTPASPAPVVTITSPTSSPTYATSVTPLALGGTATDDVGVASVTWSVPGGGGASGAATLANPNAASTTWTIAAISLLAGDNVITVTATNTGGTTSTDVITVTYTADVTAPACTITTDGGAGAGVNFGVATTPVTLAGTASDAVGVTAVTWSTDRGFSGTASGTTSWSATGITLLSGANIITVTAKDAANNSGTDTITVTYTPPVVGGLPQIQTWPGSDAASTITGALPGVLFFGSGAWRVRNNAAELENAGGLAEGGRIDIDLNTDDMLVTMTVEEMVGSGLLLVAPCARMQGTTALTYYTSALMISSGATTLTLYRRVAGTQVMLGNQIDVIYHPGITVGVWPTGSNRVRALIDDVTLIDLIDPAPIVTGHYMGMQGVANINNRARVSRLAATADIESGGGTPSGFEVTIHVPGTVAPTVTIHAAKTIHVAKSIP